MLHARTHRPSVDPACGREIKVASGVLMSVVYPARLPQSFVRALYYSGRQADAVAALQWMRQQPDPMGQWARAELGLIDRIRR